MMFMNKKISTIVAGYVLLLTFTEANAAEVKELAPPSYEVTDPASVNVATGQLSPSLTDVKIGGDMGLAHTLSSYTSNFVNWEGGPLGFTDNYNGTVYRTILYRPIPNSEDGAVYAMRVSDGSSTADFKILGNGLYEPFTDPRFELKWVPGTGYLFTRPDGTEARFSTGLGISNALPPDERSNRYAMSQIKYPNGLTIDVKSAGYSTNSRYSVKTNTGYQLKFVYEIHNRPIDPAKDINNPYLPYASSSAWSAEQPRYIYALNNSIVYCPHSSAVCTINGDWPRATHTWPDGMPKAMYVGDSEFSVANALGETTRYKHRAIDIAVDDNGNPFPGYLPPNTHFRPRIVGIEHPDGVTLQYSYRNIGSPSGNGSFAMSYMPKGEAMLTGATLVGGNSGWGYSLANPYSPNGQLDNILNGSGGYKGVNRVIMQTRYNATLEVDTWNKFVQFEQATPYYWRVSSVTDKLGGGGSSYGYDSRGNINVQSSNGITTTASYPTSCTSSNRKYCNKPEWVSDGKGNKTWYTYHAASGQVETITPPADIRGFTPKAYFVYAQHYAYVLNASGQRVQAGDPIWLKTQEYRCADSQLNGTTCAGGDLILTTYEYNHDNLHMTGSTVYSQKDNGKTVRTCYQYDIYGNQIGVTEPNASLSSCNNTHTASAFTSATRYDLLGRVTGTIQSDPDGNGPLRYAATRTTYNSKGQVTLVESGELLDWQNENRKPSEWEGYTTFTILGKAATTYDALGRKSTQRAQDPTGITFSLTQFSYSKADQVNCKAVRMNRDAYNNLPASACTLGTQGIYGPDRITRYEYTTNKEQLEREYRAVGTPLEQVYRRNHYYADGRLKGLTDANGNYTELRYNNKGWLEKRVYPSKTTPGSLNENDFNQYAYDLNGNITWERKRLGNTATISYEYDNLNRVKFKDRLDNTKDINYTYDLRGLQKTALFPSGQGITNVFDGFGNTKTSTTNMGGTTRILSYEYDNNGNRLKVIHPDSTPTNLIQFVYAFDGLNRVKSLSENTTTLLNVTYDNEGAREKLLRPGGASTGYHFDGIGRLENFTQDFTGTADDLGNTFTYNPASQVVNLNVGNDLYHYRGNNNRAGIYVPNGLNQYASIGGTSLNYDANGNLTFDGTTTYVYDEENRLTSTTLPSSSFQYDPLGRLFSATLGANTYQFLYDGDALVVEYKNGSLDRRYAHGDRVDEPWVQYEGATITSPRKFLHADHQGSIVALSSNTGAAVNKLSYDVYGIPSDTNVGRFGYTGQTWMKEVGLFHYKARMYSPKLGRFLQTDPVYYEDQMNLYAYVGNDPMNKLDPTGMVQCDKLCSERRRWELSDNWYSYMPRLSEVPTPGSSQNGNTPPSTATEKIGGALKDMFWDRPMPGEAIGVLAIKQSILLVAKAKTNLHHAWPKYLGGPAQQTLVELNTKLHQLYHKGLDAIAPRWKSTKYYDNLSSEERSQILRDFADYTRGFDAKYGTNLFSAAVDNGFKVVP